MRVQSNLSAAFMWWRLLVMAVRGAIIGVFLVTSALALVLAASALWAQVPIPVPTDRRLALALPFVVLIVMVGVILAFAGLMPVLDESTDRLFSARVDRLPYSLLALLSLVIALSVTAF